MDTKSIFESRSSGIRLRTISMFVAAAAAIVGTSAKAHADCVTVNRITDGPPYAEYDLVNKCHGYANIYWTRKGDKTTETGKWVASGCQTTHEQYFPGEYAFGSVEFPQGGDGDLCISTKDKSKAEEKVDKKSPSSAPSRINPHGSGVPVDSPLARAREAAKKKAEGAEQKNEAAAKEVKNIYKEKVDELQAEKARQAAEAEAARQNQETIRQQLEAEKSQAKPLQCFPVHHFSECQNSCFDYYRQLRRDASTFCRNSCQPGYNQHCFTIP